MKNIFIGLIIFNTAFSCSYFSEQQQSHEGYLGFKLIDIGSSPIIRDSTGKVLIDFLGNDYEDLVSDTDKEIQSYFKLLEQYDLLNASFIYINLITEKKMIKVFFNKSEMSKIEKYSRASLETGNSRVKIKFYGKTISPEIIKATKIYFIEEVPGVTLVIK